MSHHVLIIALLGPPFVASFVSVPSGLHVHLDAARIAPRTRSSLAGRLLHAPDSRDESTHPRRLSVLRRHVHISRGPRGSRQQSKALMCTSLSDDSVTSTDITPGAISVRFAIIGGMADSLGTSLAQHYGWDAKSIGELMSGRKGRRTDRVKAKAVADWLLSATGACILTGFPSTAEQARLLEEHNVLIERFIVVHDRDQADSHDDLAEGVGDPEDVHLRAQGVLPGSLSTKDATGVSEEEEQDYMESLDYLMELYESRLLEVLHEDDVDLLCRSVTRILDFDESLRSSSEDVDPALESRKEFLVPDGESADSRDAEDESAHLQSKRGSDKQVIPARFEGVRESGALDSIPSSPEDLAKTPGEKKRAKRRAISAKKRAANEAQRLDTPFYQAIAERQPQSRVRPPLRAVPSRITEKLASAAQFEAHGERNTRLSFGPLVIDSPASDCLIAAGIEQPTGIQIAGMGLIAAGKDVILHAMTGSGKTLAFLLPLMQKWAPSYISRTQGRGPACDEPFKVLLALPTRELAVQVAREAVLLAGGETAAVELLVDPDDKYDISAMTAPIVAGSAKVLERVIRKSHPVARNKVLSQVECIVIDEVDRLVDVLPKYSSPREVEARKRHARPIAELLRRVLETKGTVQVVACSATIGRPLRRELERIVRTATSGTLPNVHTDDEGSTRDLTVVRDATEEIQGAAMASNRAVPIPSTISHMCLPLRHDGFFFRLEALTKMIQKVRPRRPIVFVPPEHRVTGVVAHLKRAGGAGGRGAIALHEAIGFGAHDQTGDHDRVRGMHTSEALRQHDQLMGLFAASRAVVSEAEGGDDFGSKEDCQRAQDQPILVTGEDSARGLHFHNIDYVFLMSKPKSPDEYVHLAGRTGRQGNKGTVVSVVSYADFRKMKAWGSSLKIFFTEVHEEALASAQ